MTATKVPDPYPAPHDTVMGGRDMVILVDEDDREVGAAEKLACHQQGRLHRAVSVIVMDPGGKILLQQRATGKYHSGGLWSNSCCTHPFIGEDPVRAAGRRLREEMGLVCPLRFSRTIRYSADVGNGLIENELVHLFVGVYEGPVAPDPAEVKDFKWVTPGDVQRLIEHDPHAFSAWFKTYVAQGALWPARITGSEVASRGSVVE